MRVRTRQFFEEFAKEFAANPRLPTFETIDDHFAVLKIPTFHESKAALDKLLDENMERIAATATLIAFVIDHYRKSAIR